MLVGHSDCSPLNGDGKVWVYGVCIGDGAHYVVYGLVLFWNRSVIYLYGVIL